MKTLPISVSRRAGFTLVEALLGVSMTAICGTAVMLGLNTALETSDHATEKLLATGLAQSYLDEIMSQRYCEAGAGPQGSLGPGAPEVAGTGRSLYDDVDDFNGLSNAPPRDIWNVNYGTDDGTGGQRHLHFRLPASALQNFRVAVEVYYVNATDLTTKLTGTNRSNYRAVHARVFVDDPNGSREVVNLRRVIGYVPTH